MPGARVLVNDLKAAGIGVWGLSNWESSLFHVAEEQCDILQQLDGKLVSGFVKLRKPHKEIYEAALNQFGIKADGALFIDDKAMNIVGSNAAGSSLSAIGPSANSSVHAPGCGVQART